MRPGRERVVAGLSLVVALAAAAGAVLAAAAGEDARRASPLGSSSLRPNCSGPWSECSRDADWLRRVLAEAGLTEVPGGPGAALLVAQPHGGLTEQYLWATRPASPAIAAPYSPYSQLPRVGDTPVHTDHGVRLVWHAQGRNVWLEPPPRRDLLVKLLRSTNAVPGPR